MRLHAARYLRNSKQEMLANPGLYVHLPWCIKKCPYCDFNSHPLKESSDLKGYVASLRQEISELKELPRFGSVFFGGGTPSLFPPDAFAKILGDAAVTDEVEVTMEANPGTTEHVDWQDYLEAGINRLSLGAQTFNDKHLHTLGRIHSANEIREAFHAADNAGFENINIDLMWGLPGQTVDEALDDLYFAIQLGPEHISWYQLTIEPKTEFGARPPILPAEERLARMESEGLSRLQSAGYHRYEVSAYTRKRPSTHNLNYWEFGDYVGIGAGAHGKETNLPGIIRTQNPHQPRVYVEQPISGTRTVVEDVSFEFMLNALRLKDGVSFERYEKTTGLTFEHLKPTWTSLVNRELVRADRIETTDLGYRYLDSVVAEFLST